MAFQLSDVRQVIRNVTGRPSVTQITDAQLDDYINKYYLYVLSDDMKPYKLLVPYTFYTLANQLNYAFDNTLYLSFEPEVFCNGNRLMYYQDLSIWIQQYQYQYQSSTIGTGDGVTTNFANTPDQVPIVQGTVVVTDGVENISDNGNGTMTGSLGGSGSVNYITGLINVTFASAPALDATIYLTYAPQNPGRPRSCFYDKGSGNIQFSPIPDNTYRIDAQAYVYPTALLSSSSSPLQEVWGYTIAYGASLEIFRQSGQLDQLNMYKPEYQYYLDLASGNQTQQLANQRALPKW